MSPSSFGWGLLASAGAALSLFGCALGMAPEDDAIPGEADVLSDDEGVVDAPPEVVFQLDPALAGDVEDDDEARATLSVPTCSAAKLAEVREPATASARTVSLSCRLTLAPQDVVTKRIILQGTAASGVTIDCRGALLDGGEGTVNYRTDMIEIRSRKVLDAAGLPAWERPQNITIRSCRIVGSVRIWGMGKNGEAADVRESSRRAGHVTRVRNNAPRRITLEDLTITGVGRTPLYIAPGVTYVTLASSELTGKATSVGLYLDAESARNVIRNNYLHVTSRQEYAGGLYTRKREEVAIDGSSYNEIVDNRLSTLEGGGIYLYRNCGEGGTVRHSIPGYNQIINNVFYYNRYDGDNPAVFLGSRDNSFWEGRWYCDDDDGFPWGSSADDRSFARGNAVLQNQIYKRSVSDMIRQGDASNRPNYVAYNQTVSSAEMRLAGCYVPNGYKRFVLDGETIDVFAGAGGAPECGGYGLRCDDGRLARVSSSSCAVSTVAVDCRVSGNNYGCQRTAACPAGTRVVGAVAACNLEYGSVTAAQLATVPASYVSVLRASDHVSDGRCTAGGTSLSSGRALITGVLDRDRVAFGCREYDKNGGDCDVRAALYCR